MFSATLSFLPPGALALLSAGAKIDVKIARAAAAFTKPAPRSFCPLPSAIMLGSAAKISAFRTCRAVAFGTAWRRTAAIPATVGAAALVPLARLI